MSLFFDVLSSINNPNQGGSVQQLSQLTNTVNDLSKTNGLNPSAMQGIMSSLGPLLRPALQEQMQGGGNNALENMMGQVTGGGNVGLGGMESMLAGPLQSQIVSGIAAKTGLDSNMLQGIVPKLLPVVMGLLNMGKPTGSMGGGNPLLKSFLDADGDGDTGLGDVFKFANRFTNPSR
jgi:hypothetical protein